MILIILLFLFVASCANQSVSVDEDKMKNVKKVAVVIFTMKAKIVYRDDPKDKPPTPLHSVLGRTQPIWRFRNSSQS